MHKAPLRYIAIIGATITASINTTPPTRDLFSLATQVTRQTVNYGVGAAGGLVGGAGGVIAGCASLYYVFLLIHLTDTAHLIPAGLGNTLSITLLVSSLYHGARIGAQNGYQLGNLITQALQNAHLIPRLLRN